MGTSKRKGVRRYRAWFLTGLAAVALSASVTCSISDENGEPAVPGVYNPSGDNGNGTVDPLVDPQFLVPQVGDMRPGDTLTIEVALIDGNAANPLMPGISNAWVRMVVSPQTGWQSADSVRTDVYGIATFRYVDTTEGVHSMYFRYGTRSSEVTEFEITSNPTPIQRLITVRVDDPSLVADGVSYTNVRITVINENHNPLVGEAIQFMTTAGVIAGENPPTPEESGIAITNEGGVAVARLTSTSINDTAVVRAYVVSDMSMYISTKVAFQGVTIELDVDTTNLLPNQTTVVTATVLNGSREPISQCPIQWTLGRGGSSNFAVLGRDTLTGFDGEATLLLQATASGTDSIQVSSAGATAVLPLNVTSLKLNVRLDQTQLVASDTAKTNLRVTFTDLNDNPIANGIITVVRHYPTASGAMTSSTVTGVTGADGQATIPIAGLAYDGTMRLAITAKEPPPSQNMATAEATVRFSTTRNLTIEAYPSIVQADGSSTSDISVTIKNDKGNPIVGDTIDFSTTAGLVTGYAVTGEFGQAVGKLRSDRRNVVAKVKAVLRSDITKTDSVNVVFAGVTLVANASPRSIRGNGEDTSYISIILTDAMGNVIPAEPINWSVQKRDTTIVVEGYDEVTDNRGEAHCKVVGTGTGRDTLTIVAAGATAKPILYYSSNLLTVDTTAIGQSMVADGVSSTQMVVNYRTGQGNPIGGAHVSISVTMGALGTVFAVSDTTDVNGQVIFSVSNPTFANVATVAVDAETPTEVTTTTADFYFRASRIEYITLTVSPKTISTNGDKATVVATAYDTLNNRVAGALVAFNMLEGPGGNVRFDPPTATTGYDGVATTSFISGSIPSMYNEVMIVAGDFAGIKSDVVRLTIAGPPKYITVRSNILKGINPNDGTFGLPCAAIVSDINGNPVADGTPVTFSCKITGYVTWRYTVDWWGDADYYGWLFADIDTAYPIVIPFEDMNDNYASFELEEDRNFDGVVSRGEDLNGDGIYVPGPGFEDINHNGVRDSGQQEVEPWKRYQRQDDSAYFDPSDSTIKYITRIIWDTAWADFNGNNKIDIREPLLNKHLDSTMTWDQYVAQRDAAQGGFGYDLILNDNGMADPSTAVKILRTVQTESGIARNEVWYGQSDATKIQVTISAEAQGVITVVPDVVILPVIQ